jgi:hypothetical protein
MKAIVHKKPAQSLAPVLEVSMCGDFFSLP